jgi:hypothetical protein
MDGPANAIDVTSSRQLYSGDPLRIQDRRVRVKVPIGRQGHRDNRVATRGCGTGRLTASGQMRPTYAALPNKARQIPIGLRPLVGEQVVERRRSNSMLARARSVVTL